MARQAAGPLCVAEGRGGVGGGRGFGGLGLETCGWSGGGGLCVVAGLVALFVFAQQLTRSGALKQCKY